MAGAFYSGTGVRWQKLMASSEGMGSWLADRFKEASLESLSYSGPGGPIEISKPFVDETTLEALPPAALMVASFAVAPNQRGIEIDASLVDVEKRRWFVSAVYESHRHLILEASAADSLPRVAASSPLVRSDLQTRYGIGPIQNGDAAWEAQEVFALEQALARLSPGELEKIRGLPFRRVHHVSLRPAGLPASFEPAGLYRFGAEGRWIEIADGVFKDTELRFIGEVSNPLPAAPQMILHEIGHAIALFGVSELTLQLQESLEQLKDAMAEFNNLGRRLTVKEFPAFEALKGTIAKTGVNLNAVTLELNSGAQRSAVLREYSAIPGVLDGPTRYGSTTPGESFAESFALYHLDPLALQRVSAEAFQFFARDRHLAESRDSGS